MKKGGCRNIRVSSSNIFGITGIWSALKRFTWSALDGFDVLDFTLKGKMVA